MIYDKNPFQKIGNLLVKTLRDWEEVIFHFDIKTGNSKWSASYIPHDSEKELTSNNVLKLTSVFLDHLAVLEQSPVFPKKPCDVIFSKNGRYRIKSLEKAILTDRLTLDQIRATIDELQSLELRDANIDDLREPIGLLANRHVQASPIIPKGTKLFRGIIWDDKPNEIKKLVYPPVECVKKIHRSGRPSQVLFYCCTAREAPFWELTVKKGDKLVISQWETQEALIVNNVGYHPTVFTNLKSDRSCPTWNDRTEPRENEDINQVIKAFFSQEFSKIVPAGKEHLYKISAAIAELHFRQDMFAGLTYPTIAMRANADNVALKPKVVDIHLKLRQVEYILVEEVTENREFKVKIKDFTNSFSPDGIIEWKGRPPRWVLREKGAMLHLTVENRQWVARNESGDIVEPE